MRSTLAIAFLLVLIARAHADDDAPIAKPMTNVADRGAACTSLRRDLDPKLECKAVAHAKLGAAAVEVLATPSDIMRYAIVVTDGTDVVMSEPIEFLAADCGMMKCDVLDAHTPKLRVLHKGAMVVLEVAAKYHHEMHDTGTPRMGGRWQTYDAIVCGKAASGTYTCVARHRGGRDHSCTATLADDGTLTSRCEDVEQLTLD